MVVCDILPFILGNHRRFGNLLFLSVFVNDVDSVAVHLFKVVEYFFSTWFEPDTCDLSIISHYLPVSIRIRDSSPLDQSLIACIY